MTLIKNNIDKKSGRVRRNLKSEFPEFCWACGSEGGSSKDLEEYNEEEERIKRELRQQKGSKQEGIQETAINALQQGLDVQLVAKITGLSIDLIQELQKKL